MLNILGFFRNSSHLFVIALICVALGLLNDSNSRLKATNQRLEELLASREAQVNALRAKNDGLADSMNELVAAVRQQSTVMKQVTGRRAFAAQENRTLRDEIRKSLAADKCTSVPVPAGAADRLRDAAKAASGVQDGKATSAQPASGVDKPD